MHVYQYVLQTVWDVTAYARALGIEKRRKKVQIMDNLGIHRFFAISGVIIIYL